RDLTTNNPRKFLAVGVDEARLADTRRVQLLEIAEVVGYLPDATAVPLHPRRARARLPQHVRERRRVRRQKGDRPRPREVAVQRAAVLVSLGDECPFRL